MTKAEKRLYIREVAKELFCREGFYAGAAIENAKTLADELESFERKQDEEEGYKKGCFGMFHIRTDSSKASECCLCDCVQSCYQEKRGAK